MGVNARNVTFPSESRAAQPMGSYAFGLALALLKRGPQVSCHHQVGVCQP